MCQAMFGLHETDNPSQVQAARDDPCLGYLCRVCPWSPLTAPDWRAPAGASANNSDRRIVLVVLFSEASLALLPSLGLGLWIIIAYIPGAILGDRGNFNNSINRRLFRGLYLHLHFIGVVL
jgi:hypothetical protein